MNKIYAFGDVHGQASKLEALINKLNLDKNDKLIFLGDYIDRGNKSFEVIECLINLNKKHDCIFLKGNHEKMFIDYLEGKEEFLFLDNGGTKTLKSYFKYGYNIGRNLNYLDRRMPRNHINFLRNLKNFYETEDYIFVHAGIKPGVPPEELSEMLLFWDRTFHYYCTDYKGKTVVFGHTPSPNVLNEKNKICIDTGACYDYMGMGVLTCVSLPDRNFIQQK